MHAARILAICALALPGAFLAACTPVGTNYTAMSVAMPPLKPGEGRIFFYTPPVRWGGNDQPDVKVNGAVAGFSVPGGFFYADRPAGRYEVTGDNSSDGRITVPLAAGESKYVRTKAASGFSVNRLDFLLVPATEGQAEMAGLIYSGVPLPQ